MSIKNIRAAWIELIGFDNRQPDMGIADCLDKFGFIPDVLVLLVWSSNFVHSYSPDDPDDTLLGWDCSSYGCRRQGLDHEIQQWSKGQVKTLVSGLRKLNIEVYLSFFDQLPHPGQLERFQIPEVPKLWVHEHPELFYTMENGEISRSICPWKRLADGSCYEDFLIGKLIPCLKEYGFTGLHGADGYAHQRIPISRGDFSDDMVGQSGILCELKCDGDPGKIRARAADILLNHRKEWTDFYRRRYGRFWKHVSAELHQNGFKLIMNSFWTRDPFESIFRYGADYSLLAELDLEALVLEAPVADELTVWHSTNVREVYKCLASLLRIRAVLPDVPIWHMNTLRDVLEDYNVVQEFPALLEAGTELLQHALLYHNKKWSYSLSGILSCLSDGLTRDNWNWVRSMWDFVLSKPEICSHPGVAVVFSRSMLERELDAYLDERFASSWHLHWLLLGAGAPLNSSVPLDEVPDLPENTPLAVLNSRFLSAEEEKILERHPGRIFRIDASERCAPALNDPRSFIYELQEPAPADEQVVEWAKEIAAMVPDAPSGAEGDYHVFEERLAGGEKLLTVFNDQLYHRNVTVRVSEPFVKIKALINHLMPPHTAEKMFIIHLPSFGVVAVKLRSLAEELPED